MKPKVGDSFKLDNGLIVRISDCCYSSVRYGIPAVKLRNGAVYAIESLTFVDACWTVKPEVQ